MRDHEVWRSAVKRAAAGLTLGLLCFVAAAPVAGAAEAATRPGYASTNAVVAAEPAGQPASGALPPRRGGWAQRAQLAPVLDLTEPAETTLPTPDSNGTAGQDGPSSLAPTDVGPVDARAPPAEGSA